MLKERMYVRIPADKESMQYPRIFISGQIVSIDEFSQTYSVLIHDPFNMLQYYELLPNGIIDVSNKSALRCSFFKNSTVFYRGVEYEVMSYPIHNKKTDYYDYYLKSQDTKEIVVASEKDIVASFTNANLHPITQMLQYEFQNPCWYFGRSIVSKSMNLLDNSIYGFKELTGAKIFLLPHQVNTIMRCLKEMPCRYMLADEVGLGKTIEAISVYKIFLENNSATNALIAVPKSLVEQWKTELFFKFNIYMGENKNDNFVIVKAIEELDVFDLEDRFDFVIIDEVHKYLNNKKAYANLFEISKHTKNLLMLSATPVQERKFEYLNLLKLLLPKKYSKYSINDFEELLKKQKSVMQYADFIIDGINDLESEIKDLEEESMAPHESEDCEDIFEEIMDNIKKISKILNDSKLIEFMNKINFDSEDCGLYEMRVCLSYICGNYQIENNIIRNRRGSVKQTDESTLANRQLIELEYDFNEYDSIIYGQLEKYIRKSTTEEITSFAKPFLNSFFSSSLAFKNVVKNLDNKFNVFDDYFYNIVEKMITYDKFIVNNIFKIIDNPTKYSKYYTSKMVKIIEFIYEEITTEKVVLFTSFDETFNTYKKLLENFFEPDLLSFFNKDDSSDDIELNIYRFQNEKKCQILLCDISGGEGRNFQNADYLIHIDIPWDANMIEQRIGRLDRLERAKERLDVYSVVPYCKDSFEEALFNFWNKGLNIFQKSISGMEIVMPTVNDEMYNAIMEDLENGLFDHIDSMIELTERIKKIIKKEQRYDTAAMLYKPMYIELSRIINYFNKNESELFAKTMLGWAAYAGFVGASSGKNIISFSPKSFSPASAYKALLIPPKWNEYLMQKHNSFINHVKSLYDSKNNRKSNNRTINGTFSRKVAIENDYLRFFSPGDEIYDCIVENAMQSTKGTASAFAAKSNLEWKGLIFTWSIRPDENLIYENDISIHSLNSYRNFLASNSISIPISIENFEDYSDETIIKEFDSIINKGFNKKDIVHLGRRSKSMGFLNVSDDGMKNIEWIISQLNFSEWIEILKKGRVDSKNKAFEILKNKSNLRGAKEEMQRELSARIANVEYYGIDDDGIEELKRTQLVILKSLATPVLKLDSVAYVWLVKNYD